MEICTVGAGSAPEDRFDRAFVVLRRAGVVLGLLFGLGIVALVVADRAAADDRGGSPPQHADNGEAPVAGGLGRLTEPLTGPVAEIAKPVADVVKPVADVAEPVVAPVVKPVAAAVAPVTDAVAPVLRPVVVAVQPVLDGTAPVTERLLPPVPDAAKPVPDAPGPVPGAQRSPTEPSTTSKAVRASVTSAVRSTPDMAPGSPGPQPGSPTAPVPFAVTGGGVAGGTGGQHGGDAADVGGPSGVVERWTGSGRGPPGTIVGTPWFGYDDRDHPS